MTMFARPLPEVFASRITIDHVLGQLEAVSSDADPKPKWAQYRADDQYAATRQSGREINWIVLHQNGICSFEASVEHPACPGGEWRPLNADASAGRKK